MRSGRYHPAMSERQRWTTLSAEHPYWTVLAERHYRADQITPEAVREFYATGEAEVAETFERIRRLVAPDFQPKLSVDYGSGMGRLALPIAGRSTRAIGVDISDPMLAGSRRHAAEAGITNVEFVHADAFMAANDAAYPLDFVHSYIVLQHIPVPQGMRVTETLVRRLVPGGVAALHYTWARNASLLRRIVHPARIAFPPLNVLANIVQGKPTFEPMIPMHHYSVPALFELFGRHGAREIHVIPTDQGGHLGGWFIFRKEVAARGL